MGVGYEVSVREGREAEATKNVPELSSEVKGRPADWPSSRTVDTCVKVDGLPSKTSRRDESASRGMSEE